MDTNNSFGRLLKECRTDAKMTLGDVAQHLGCTIGYVSDVEHGRRNPLEGRQIAGLAKLWNIDPTPLLEAAAKGRCSVKITSKREDVLELAAGLARILEGEQESDLKSLKAFMETTWKRD